MTAGSSIGHSNTVQRKRMRRHRVSAMVANASRVEISIVVVIYDRSARIVSTLTRYVRRSSAWSLGGSDRFLFYAIQDGPDIALFEPQCFHDQALQISNDRGASPRSIITDNGESLPRSSRHNMVMDCIGRICLQSADALMASCSALWRICSKITPSNCQFRPVLPDSARHNSTMARCSVFWWDIPGIASIAALHERAASS